MPRKPAGSKEPEQEKPEEAQAPPNAVIVYRTKDEEGISVDFTVVGDVELLETPTILSIALKAAKARFGVE